MAAFATGSTDPLPLTTASLIRPVVKRFEDHKHVGATVRLNSNVHQLVVQSLDSQGGDHVAVHVIAGPFKGHFSIVHKDYNSNWGDDFRKVVSIAAEVISAVVLTTDRERECCIEGEELMMGDKIIYMEPGIVDVCVMGMFPIELPDDLQSAPYILKQIFQYDQAINAVKDRDKDMTTAAQANETALGAVREQAAKDIAKAAALTDAAQSNTLALKLSIVHLRSQLAAETSRANCESKRAADAEAENAQLREHVRQSAMALTLLQRPRGASAGSGPSYDVPDDVSVVRSDATRAAGASTAVLPTLPEEDPAKSCHDGWYVAWGL
jgi:hypothetical protein